MKIHAAPGLLLLCAGLSPARAQGRGDVNQGSAWQWVQEQPAPEAFVRAAAAPPRSAPAAHPDDPWERVSRPSRAASESVGFYSRGCIRGAVELPVSGPGYERMRLSRRRGFGHPRLLRFLKTLGARASADPAIGTILIGDMGYPRGGPFRTGHKSHQTGLDVDVWYRQVPNGTKLGDADRETWASPELVSYDREGFYTGLSPNWDPKEMTLLRLAASDAGVERVFVSPVIKKLACSTHRGEAWVSKIRAEWGHGDHFHVRLHCVGPKCEAQAPVPDDNCGPELDAEWFSPSARETWRKISHDDTPWSMPKLPAECAAVLSEP